jgi:hypothetical protein
LDRTDHIRSFPTLSVLDSPSSSDPPTHVSTKIAKALRSMVTSLIAHESTSIVRGSIVPCHRCFYSVQRKMGWFGLFSKFFAAHFMWSQSELRADECKSCDYAYAVHLRITGLCHHCYCSARPSASIRLIAAPKSLPPHLRFTFIARASGISPTVSPKSTSSRSLPDVDVSASRLVLYRCGHRGAPPLVSFLTLHIPMTDFTHCSTIFGTPSLPPQCPHHCEWSALSYLHYQHTATDRFADIYGRPAIHVHPHCQDPTRRVFAHGIPLLPGQPTPLVYAPSMSVSGPSQLACWADGDDADYDSDFEDGDGGFEV